MLDTNVTRQPRAIVRINGYSLRWLSWDVNNNGFYQADTFAVTLPITQAGEPDITPKWWSNQRQFDVEIWDGFPADPSDCKYTSAELSHRITGLADSIEIDPVSRTVMLTGRDYTSRLIDAKDSTPDTNKTASQVVTKYAKDHGLTPVVTPTATKIGNYYQLEHVNTKTLRSKWDILTHLANDEHFDLWASGQELHFAPKEIGENAIPLKFDESGSVPQFPGMKLRFHRDLTMARGIVVKVRSWNFRQPKGYTVTAKTKAVKDPVLKKAAHVMGEPQTYYYNVPNKTRKEAEKIARAKLLAISQHQIRMTAEFPADPGLNPRQPIRVEWSNGAWDQIYYIDSIVRHMSASDYSMTVSAKNHDVESTVAA